MSARLFGVPVFERAVLKPSEIPFDPAARAACEENRCGLYGACWMCPPDVGEPEALQEQARAYENAAVFSMVYPLEDAFDVEGMANGARTFNRLALTIRAAAEAEGKRCLALGAGACGLCERCRRRDNLPCRFPERAISSLEAYGVSVAALAKRCRMRYYNGKNTVTYFGLLLTESQ